MRLADAQYAEAAVVGAFSHHRYLVLITGLLKSQKMRSESSWWSCVAPNGVLALYAARENRYNDCQYIEVAR